MFVTLLFGDYYFLGFGYVVLRFCLIYFAAGGFGCMVVELGCCVLVDEGCGLVV